MQLPGFLKRPSHTLLYITESKTFRIDTDRKGVIKGEVTAIDCQCKSSSAIPVILETVFADDQLKPGRKVWLLYVRLTTYALSLPSVQVEGVEDNILQQALQFEYEGLTGHSLNKSFLAYHYIGAADEMSSYWITLIAQETLNNIKEILAKKRCKYGGLTHPGGLPYLISGIESPSWLRIETWSNTVFALAKTPEEGLSLQIFHSQQNPDWQDEVDHWILDTGEVDKSEAIMNNKIEYLPQTDENYRLSLDGALVFWLGLWAQHLIADDNIAVPLLNPQKTINKEILYMVGSGTVALLLCIGHFSWNLYLRNDYRFKNEELHNIEKQSGNLRKTLTASRNEVDKLRAETDLVGKNIALIPEALDALQKRPLALLKTLSLHTPEDLLIEQIEQQGDRIIISGDALQPQLINLFANAIETDITALGWKSETPTKEDKGLFQQGGPWSFVYALEDQGLDGFIKNQLKTP